MGKTIAVILSLVFVLAACTQETVPDTVFDVVVPAPSVTPEPEPMKDVPEHGLLNYLDWYELYPEDAPPPDFEVELDTLISSIVRDDGYVSTAVMFPRQWPVKQLGDTIPEYTGTGYMQAFYISHPNMSLRTEDIESVKLTIYRYKEEDMNNYIDNLPGFTPDEELAEEYYREHIESSPYLQSVQSFRKDGIVLHIIFAEDVIEGLLNTGKFIQLEIRYSRDEYSFDPEAAEATELLNFFDFAKEMEFEVPAEMRLDYLMDSYEGQGMYYRLISAPSKWPRDAFGDLLPMYTGFGFMQQYEITTPQYDTSPEKALMLSVGITTDDTRDIEAYLRRVSDFGYYELPPEEYSEYENSLVDERDLVRIFSLPGHTCMISAYERANLPTLEIMLRFDGRRVNFLNAEASSGEQGTAQGSPPMV